MEDTEKPQSQGLWGKIRDFASPDHHNKIVAYSIIIAFTIFSVIIQFWLENVIKQWLRNTIGFAF